MDKPDWKNGSTLLLVGQIWYMLWFAWKIDMLGGSLGKMETCDAVFDKLDMLDVLQGWDHREFVKSLFK